ncbi:MAG: PAS domain S-box protein [Desulfobacterales bacterium]|nr:PAS domain S-box protein [Desulfobacterales bacterium]
MKATLGKKIVLIVTAILLLTTLAGVWVSGAIFSHVYSKALQSKTSLIGGFLASQVNRLLALGIPLDELVGFEVQCREVVENHEEISYAMVVDPKGRILFHSDPSRHGTVVSAERLKGIDDFHRNSSFFSSMRVRESESLVPLFDDDHRRIGGIIVGFPEGVVAEAARRLVLYSAAASFLFYGIAVGLLLFALSAWIGKPLGRLHHAIGEVASGGRSFYGTVEISSNDEIGEIAAAFNKMRESLQRTTVSRDYARAIVESVSDALIVTDRDLTVIQVNRAARELLDYRDEELLGKEIRMFFSPDEKATVDPLLRLLAANRRVRSQQLSFSTREGRKIPVLFSASWIRDAEGQIFRIATGKDITGLKKAEDALRKSEDRYRDLVEYSQAIICTHDLEGRFLSVNRAATKSLKYDAETLLAMKVPDLLVPETRSLFENYRARIKQTGRAEGLMWVQTAEGEERLLEYRNTLRTEGVEEPVVRGMLFDVTDRKRLEKERKELIQGLQSALAKVKTLSGMLPICASCHKIRADSGYWEGLEKYIEQNSEAIFTHGICPDCEQKLYPFKKEEK